MTYTTKVWVITILVSPIIFWIFNALYKGESIAQLHLLLPNIISQVVAGMFILSPLIVIFWFLEMQFKKSEKSNKIKNIIQTSIACLGIAILYLLIIYKHNQRSFWDIAFPLSYMLTSGLSIFLIKRK